MNFLEHIDEETAREMLGQLDEDDVEETLRWVIEDQIVPHLEDVRERANNEDPPRDKIREYYESMSEQQREEEFYETLDEFVATLVICRERPIEGFRELKAYLRDPYTVEALLLIFENEDYIDPGYTQTLKDFGVEHIRWVGAMVLPEMYSDEEVEDVMQTFDINPDAGFEGEPPIDGE